MNWRIALKLLECLQIHCTFITWLIANAMASGSKKVVIAALIGNGLIAITKFIAASISGSSAMMSEGIHSLVDTGNQVLLLLGMHRAKKPADKNFPFGHGKEIYFWSFVVAMLIFAVGSIVSIYEGVHRLQHPEPMTNYLLTYIVLIVAIGFESVALTLALKEFNKVRGKNSTLNAVRNSKDSTLFVVLFEDSAAMLGLVVALIGVTLSYFTDQLFWDGLAAIVIGCILAMTAVWLAIETKGLLIGESASPEIQASVRSIIESEKSIQSINEISTLHMGPEFILVTISVDFLNGIASENLERSVSQLSDQIKQVYPQVKRVFIEAESLKTHTIGYKTEPLSS